MQEAHRRRIEALNGLSSFAYVVKNQLGDQDGIVGKISDDDKKKILDAVKDVTEWIDDNAQTTFAEEFEKKLHEVQSVINSITGKY